MPENTPARRALEQELNRKLQQARERYFRAADELHRQIFETGIPPDEHSPALATTRQREATAFAEYCRALATYTELIANGKLPDSPACNVAGRSPREPE